MRVALLGELDRRCWPERSCPRALQVRVSNCTDEALGVSGVIITQTGNEGQLHLEFETGRYRAPAHSQLTFPLGRPEGNAMWPLTSHTLRIRVTPPIALRESESTAIFALRDSAKEEAESSCRGNGDDWGMHGGLAPREGCEPVMHDAGTRCVDARECQGRCLFERAWRVSATRKRVQGTCTRYEVPLGCRTYIGETEHGLISAGVRLPTICTD